MQIVCTEQVSRDLSPGTTIQVLFETYDIPGSQAQGTYSILYVVSNAAMSTLDYHSQCTLALTL